MKKSVLAIVLISFVLIFLALSFATAFWPFTGFTSRTAGICEDSDSGVNENNAGVVKYTSGDVISFTNDSCIIKGNKNYIREYSCKGDKVKSKEILCTGSCEVERISAFEQEFSAGKCTNQPVGEKFVCQDTDNGINATEPGIVNATKKSETRILGDACGNKTIKRQYYSTLIERYCTKKSKLKETEILCKGSCLETTRTFRGQAYPTASCEPLYRCIDNDGGKNTTKKGTVSVYDENGTFSYNATEFCRDEKHVVELGCSRKTCEEWGKGQIWSTHDLDTILFGDEECEWVFAESSATSSRIHLKIKGCKDGCSNGACLSGEERE